jgi:capsular polysaccharide transport system ATP-binding protein
MTMAATTDARRPGPTNAGGAVAPLRAELAPGRPAAAATKSIRVEGLVKDYHTTIGRKRVLDGISFEVRMGEKMGVLGRNGAGKSTLVRLLAGVEQPTAGRVERGLYMSWPLGLASALPHMMTGMDNIRFIARLYDRPIDETIDFVDDFAELGRNLLIPLKEYSSGMMMRLAFALTLAIDFDCLLIDEVLAVGDQRFNRKCHDALFVQRRDKALILVSHSQDSIRGYCDRALVLKEGRGRVFDDMELALDIYRTL